MSNPHVRWDKGSQSTWMIWTLRQLCNPRCAQTVLQDCEDVMKTMYFRAVVPARLEFAKCLSSEPYFCRSTFTYLMNCPPAS
jgi:hypothetical protein